MLRTEARITLIDGALATAVLVGVALNAAAGLWWADPVAALVLVLLRRPRGPPRLARSGWYVVGVITQERVILGECWTLVQMTSRPAPRMTGPDWRSTSCWPEQSRPSSAGPSRCWRTTRACGCCTRWCAPGSCAFHLAAELGMAPQAISNQLAAPRRSQNRRDAQGRQPDPLPDSRSVRSCAARPRAVPDRGGTRRRSRTGVGGVSRCASSPRPSLASPRWRSASCHGLRSRSRRPPSCRHSFRSAGPPRARRPRRASGSNYRRRADARLLTHHAAARVGAARNARATTGIADGAGVRRAAAQPDHGRARPGRCSGGE